jgi:hypothetical protein
VANTAAEDALPVVDEVVAAVNQERTPFQTIMILLPTATVVTMMMRPTKVVVVAGAAEEAEGDVAEDRPPTHVRGHNQYTINIINSIINLHYCLSKLLYKFPL